MERRMTRQNWLTHITRMTTYSIHLDWRIRDGHSASLRHGEHSKVECELNLIAQETEEMTVVGLFFHATRCRSTTIRPGTRGPLPYVRYSP